MDDAISIRLADARTPIRDVDSEREVFLPGNASDSEDEDEDAEEARKKEERRRVLGNPIAQRSGVNISGRKDRVSEEEEEEDYEIVAGPRQSGVHSVRLTLQDADDRVGGSHDHQGGLSSKAGIILVRFHPPPLLCFCVHLTQSIFSGNTQRIHRDTAVPRHRSVRHRLCHIRSAEERPPWAPNTQYPRRHKRDDDGFLRGTEECFCGRWWCPRPSFEGGGRRGRRGPVEFCSLYI